MVSPVVRGVFAESKKWAAAKKCTALQIEELSGSRFKVYASCDGCGVLVISSALVKRVDGLEFLL